MGVRYPGQDPTCGGQLTVYAADRTAFLRASETLKLANDYAPVINLSLEPDLSATIHGSVLDIAGPGKPLAGAHVHILGYEREAVVTSDTGDFMYLPRQGTSIKTIGDLLGHRSPESTGIYLRLQIQDLRDVALPLPLTVDCTEVMR